MAIQTALLDKKTLMTVESVTGISPLGSPTDASRLQFVRKCFAFLWFLENNKCRLLEFGNGGELIGGGVGFFEIFCLKLATT
jgi:hypothetical protein